MPTILISGAASGLGASFLDAYHSEPDVTIIAIDQSPIPCDLARVEAFQVDVTDEASVEVLRERIKDRTIDLVIHSAGMRGLVPAIEDSRPHDVASCEVLEVMTVDTMLRAFHVNTIGTFMLLRALLGNLKKAKDPKVVVMASRMGSVGNNEVPNKDAGSAYAYRASKAAANTIVRSLAVDVPEVTFIMCHPGRVETNLVRCREEGAVTAQESVSDVLRLIPQWTTVDSGKFYDRFGNVIQW